jgi:hypothetical protein
MKESKYTPGPWTVSEPPDALIVRTSDGRDIAWIDDSDQGEGNAALVATAPDLYAALVALYDLVPQLTWPAEHREDIMSALDRASAALRKAEGDE